MNINMKRDFESIIRKYGHDIYLQRVNNPQTGNETPDYADKLEKWTVYSMFPGGSMRAGRTTDEADEGHRTDVDMIFYFQAEANPTTGDRIYEEIDRFPDHQALYVIEFAIPMRGTNGALIFWECGSMRKLPV